MSENQRGVSQMKFHLNKALIEWNDSQADKEAILKILQKVEDNFEPTEDEINNIETEINRERKFNTVSKLKHSLDSAQQTNARKFKARYKQTNNMFLREVEMIVRLANLEMEEHKTRGNSSGINAHGMGPNEAQIQDMLRKYGVEESAIGKCVETLMA